MTIWELRSGDVNNHTCLVFNNSEQIDLFFELDGEAKSWASPPTVSKDFEKRRKKQKPVADFAHLMFGAMVFSAKAEAVLAPFLSQFGQLLPLNCGDDQRYFYNVTNLIDCIDEENCEYADGRMTKEKFILERIPETPQIFKAPLTVEYCIYLNQAAKDVLEQAIAEHELTGARILEAGQDLD